MEPREQLDAIVKAAVAEAIAPLQLRIKELEDRPQPKDGEPGKPGAPGRDGRDSVVAGKDGTNGIDGLGFDNFTFERQGRIMIWKFHAGDRTKTFEVYDDSMKYRGTFRETETYERGDCTTFGGSLWCLTADNPPPQAKPAEDSKAWTLVAKRGRDGRSLERAPVPPVTGVALKG